MISSLNGLKVTPKKRAKETNPLKIFETLTLRGTVENIWDPQSEALRSWDAVREKKDVVLEMNTGGGKTLIGVLMAQSLVNETAGHIVYVCPTIQLIEQAKMRAEECGLEVATYYEGTWSNEHVFTGSYGPCFTNYAAVFNGKSIFRKKQIAAFILDDAHVAGPSIRQAFTLRLTSTMSAFSRVIDLFKPYLEKSGHAQELAAMLNGDGFPLYFIPGFELNRQWQKLTQILIDENIAATKATLFAWKHLRDHLNRCAVLISATGVEISPLSLPLAALPYFYPNPRRIYLTATMPSPVQFAQTFGVDNAHVIRPGGKSGDSQRLFVFARGSTDEEHQQWAKAIINPYKACVITPSKPQAIEWTDVAELYDGSTGQQGVEGFKAAAAPAKLVMAARYDGVDLPGDACRVLVLDGIPVGSFAIDRFIDQTLNLAQSRTSTTAIRLTQAIGRIFRSNTDHGVVVLCGAELQSWLRNPNNQSFLPDLLQRQIQLGIQLREMVEGGETSYEACIEGILNGDREWDRIYKTSIGEYDIATRQTPAQWLIDAANEEGPAFLPLWEGNFAGASLSIRTLADSVAASDKKLAAWYGHWCGLAQEMSGQSTAAVQSYQDAANNCAALGRPAVSSRSILASVSSPTPSVQANRVAQLAVHPALVQKTLRVLKGGLVYGENTNSVEAALSELGRLLGLEASRPDNQPAPKGTGPDVLWRYTPSKSGVALEAKTKKKEGSQYQKKDDIGQFHDHLVYLRKHYKSETFFQAIVGRQLPVSGESNPTDELRIVPLEGFQELVGRVEQMYNFIGNSTDTDPVAVKAERWLETLGLSWPQCFDSLPYTLANDLKKPNLQPEQVF
ncbi:MAG: type restriction protein res subunit [Candidatus Sulfotelmatobacter sp.]|nr:type restriction protein res subunit [Candidatus Sulfotelmatobacter sp.]